MLFVHTDIIICIQIIDSKNFNFHIVCQKNKTKNNRKKFFLHHAAVFFSEPELKEVIKKQWNKFT